jgi:hypothetical protein
MVNHSAGQYVNGIVHTNGIITVVCSVWPLTLISKITASGCLHVIAFFIGVYATGLSL